MKARQTLSRRSITVNRPLRALWLCELSDVIGGLNPQPEPPRLNPQPEPPG